MKTVYIFTIIVFSNCIKAQFEDDQNYWGSSETKLSGFEAKDEATKQHNFFSSHHDNLHHINDAENNLNLYQRRFDDGFEKANNIGINTEADIASAFARRRLESESKLIGLNGDNMRSDGSIVSGVQSNSNETQKKSSSTDYNIFDAKSAVKYQTVSSIPTLKLPIPTTLKPTSDQIVKYKDITILIIDENNKIHNKLSVPILNTSHIIIKAFSNNLITDLQPGSIASNEKYLQREPAVTSKELETTNRAALGKLTYTTTNSQALDHSWLFTTTQFPSINTTKLDSIDSKIKNSQHFIPVNTHRNEVVQRTGELNPNLRTTVLKTNENRTEHTSYTTDNSVGGITSGVRSFLEQQTLISSIYLNQKPINGTVIKKYEIKELDPQSSIEPTVLKMSKSISEESTSAITHTSKRYTANSTSATKHTGNYVDSTTGNLNFFSPTETPKETTLKNNSPSEEQGLQLSLKPAVLEIIENTDHNKNMSSKNHFVNVYVPTIEFTQTKNKSNEQYKALDGGKMELLRIDSSTKNETITSRPAKNSVHEIESSTPTGKSWITTNEGLGLSKINYILSQVVSVGSKITTPSISSETLKPLSKQIFKHNPSMPKSLEEDTNALINILLGQQNQSIVAAYSNTDNNKTTTEHLPSSKQTVAIKEIQ
ncbi:hypothetical protein LSTR_LSTR010243 [Laodelphax striatellus]|uniref:Uncharacterized protein n=1 Tax=Laodelphax striatellus TaxID=195883 RepID=A0A482WL75_LAOST|nr:hypothetical protein LSTR_LSTR010243 [Laodelphax striatellus]